MTAADDAAAVLRRGEWSAVEVAALLDVPLRLVVRWAQTGVVPGCRLRAGAWRLPGRGLFFFLGRRVECHYTPATVAALLDKPVGTVREWIKAGRLRVVKLGVARQAPTLVPESALVELLIGERRPK